MTTLLRGSLFLGINQLTRIMLEASKKNSFPFRNANQAKAKITAREAKRSQNSPSGPYKGLLRLFLLSVQLDSTQKSSHSTHFLPKLLDDSSGRCIVITLSLPGVALHPHFRHGKEVHHSQSTEPQLPKHRRWLTAHCVHRTDGWRREGASRVARCRRLSQVSGDTRHSVLWQDDSMHRSFLFCCFCFLLSNNCGLALRANQSTPQNAKDDSHKSSRSEHNLQLH